MFNELRTSSGSAGRITRVVQAIEKGYRHILNRVGTYEVYTGAMSTEVSKKSAAIRRTLARRNSMAFPRELRDAIPPLHDGRILELDSINGHAQNTVLFGPLVELKLVVKETGKSSLSYVVLIRLQPDAARKLAVTLTELADQTGEAERTGPKRP